VNYLFRSPAGTFVIKPHRTEPEKVELWISDESCGAFATAQEAAENVRERCAALKVDPPPSLSAWERFG
jgi:hypothetical protein